LDIYTDVIMVKTHSLSTSRLDVSAQRELTSPG